MITNGKETAKLTPRTMIQTATDLLTKLIEAERRIIEAQPDLNHMPMLGDMYEGLARHAMEHVVFQGLGLSVVEGKIKYSDGTLSGQIDCMIVCGEGDKLPHTSHHIYEMEQVIAVMEVKKTLYSRGLEDSFLHLRDVNDLNAKYNIGLAKLAASAWRAIMVRPYPNEGEALGAQEDMIRHVLNVFSHQPIRIVLGYDGFKSEFALREGLCRFLKKQIKGAQDPVPGFGAASFPSLIISSKASVVRLDGMPYAGSLTPGDDYWPLLASSSGNPFQILLEILWTRLTYLYDLPHSIFGEDLKVESVNKFIGAKLSSRNGLSGWEYRYTYISKKKLNLLPQHAEWQPEELSLPEFTIINELCRKGEVDATKQTLHEYFREHGTTVEAVATSLSQKHLAALSGNKFRLLTKECQCAIHDGRFLAAENNTGRFTRWYLKQSKK